MGNAKDHSHLDSGQLAVLQPCLSQREDYVQLCGLLEQTEELCFLGSKGAQTRDAASVKGRNVINIRQEFGKNPREMVSRELRGLYKYRDIPVGERWKLELLMDMLWDRQGMVDTGMEGEELDLLQSYINILAEI